MHDPDYRDHLRYAIEHRRVVFDGRQFTTAQAVAFVAGFNMASGYCMLRGFDEWLIVKLGGGGYNIHWYGLVQYLAHGVGVAEPWPTDLPAEEEEQVAVRVLEAVVEFLDTMEDRWARHRVHAAYIRHVKEDGAYWPGDLD